MHTQLTSDEKATRFAEHAVRTARLMALPVRFKAAQYYCAPADASCVVHATEAHVWVETAVLGRCLRGYRCECGGQMTVDSSD